MAVQNPSFETPGVEPGQADQWSEGYGAGASVLADFTHYDGYTRPYDDFEQSWGSNHNAQSSFAVTDIVTALFSNQSRAFENFEESWWEPHTPATGPHNGSAYLYFYSGNFLTAQFNSGSEAYEDFEEGWGVSPYNESSIYAFAAGTFSTASFDSGTPEAVEDFEEEWKDNENATSSITSTVIAPFGVTPDYFESFESGWTETLPL